MKEYNTGFDQSTFIAFCSAAFAIISVGARILVQGPPFKFWKIMGALAAGVFLAGVTSQALLEYKLVSSNFAVWLSGLIAIIGDHIVIAIWQIGEQAKRNPLKTLSDVMDALKGNYNQPEESSNQKDNTNNG